MTAPRLSLGAKLGGLAALLCALMALVVIVSVAGMSNIAADGHRSYAKSTIALDELADARGAFLLNRTLALQVQLASGRAAAAKLQRAIAANDHVVDQHLAAFRATIVAGDGSTADAKLVADIARYRAARTDASRQTLGDAITTQFAALQRIKTQQADVDDVEATNRFHDSRTLSIVLLLAALVLGVGAAFAITRNVRRSVGQILSRLTSLRERDTRQLQDGLAQLAAGDLTVVVTAQTEPITKFSRDELGDVAQAVNAVRADTEVSMQAYNATREALAELIGQVAGTAATVSSASQQMASTSEETGRAVAEIAGAVGEIAAGAMRQVTGIEDARRLTEEIVAATGRSAGEASATAQVAQDARQIAADGASAVAQATEAMASVRSASASATEAIRALGDKSGEIGGIIDTITQIAEQTNLLALNAAIEAARAGDQGRGFAVVADEVRKLAEESQEAAATIAALIGEIQSETSRAVATVEDGAAQTAQGSVTVEEARAAFERIGDSVQDVTDRAGEIAAAVQEIAASSAQTGQRIGEIAAVAEQSSASTEQVSASTEQTSASAQEISASAQELALTARDLEALVGRFTLS
jgi:methyl-accepting chemotaxis protein